MTTLEMIDELRKRGVKRAKLAAGEVYEVEFFGSDAPPGVNDGEIDAASQGAAEPDGTEGYALAIKQLGRKKFVKQGEA